MSRNKRNKTKKQDERTVPSDIDVLTQNYLKMREQKTKEFQDTSRKMMKIQHKLHSFRTAPYYHERNKYIEKYKRLGEQRKECLEEKWFVNFVQDHHTLIQKQKSEIQNSKTNVLTPPPLKTEHIVTCEVPPVPEETIDPRYQTQQLLLAQTSNSALGALSSHTTIDTTQQTSGTECTNPACPPQSLRFIPREARMVCMGCGEFSKHQSSTSGGLFTDEVDMHHAHQYDPKKNFKTFVMQFSENAKEIPDELIAELLQYLQRNMKRTRSELKATKCKNFLKAHPKWRKYLDCATKIVNILNNRANPKFTQTQIDTFVSLFDEIQLPFAHCKDPQRQNFLNSCYLMNKFCGLLGLVHEQHSFPLLRHSKSLLEQDHVWEAICAALKWVFQPSI